MTRTNFHPMFNHILGIEAFIRDMDKLTNADTHQDKYPPHSIIRQSDNHYLVELAVAGFTLDELSIVVEDSVLKITGTKNVDEDKRSYIHKGISTKNFTKTIRLVDTVQVGNATYTNGILSIELENVIPEYRKPKQILINNKQLLTENK